FPFERLIEELQPKRDLSRSPLFDMMVVLQNAFDPVAGARQSDGLPLEQMQVTSGITKYDLTFSFAEDKDRLLLELEYNTDLFKEQTVKRLLTYLEQLFATSSQHKNLALKNISLVDEQTTKGLLAKLDRTAVSYDAEASILSHFETVVNRFPDRKALSVGDQDWTYQQLDEWSGKLAHKLLQERGVQREELIALHMSRSHWMIVAIMGVLKAGAAYVPIDPEYPDARKEFILEDSGCRLVLSDGPVQEGAETREGQEWIDLSSEDWDVPTASTSVDPHNLAYVIYTSGTTGQPKGVLIEHRHVSRLLFNDQPLFDFDQYDRWTLFHSYCFDFSVWEIFGALLHGAQLFVVPKGVAQDALSFYDFLADHRISVLNQTPSAFRSLSMLNENRFDAQPLAVRYLVFGGEALMPSWLEAWQDAFDNCRIVNMYGITETTVHVTYKEITAVEIQANKSNIGLPIPTLSCFVLDRDLQPVVPGVIGELCVGGAGVARGYLNRDELTKEKFIAHPLHPEQRIYRSGDFARLLPNGDLEYIGRKDAQVKIRGHRIETGEIESIIKNQADIRDAVVRVYQNQQGENELVAYVILQEELEFDRSVMRNQLRDALPAYMLPSHLLQLTELPLTANGKLDVTALPSPDRGGADERSYAAPRNETDEQIIAIWKDVLEKETIGINDNFFDLGGHSLKATRVISALQEQFGVSIDIKNMFIEPTVAYLSDYIATLQWMNEAEEVELSSSEEETRLIL
ncbi:MAG: amino acid adenylation domain-containing protein, partial [Bacteroidota bacterium]